MMGPKTAMILAAGLGLRMRPLTDNTPKALVEVAGQPLIGHLLDRLEEAGVTKIVVNIHYKPDPLFRYLNAHRFSGLIDISDERQKILETGGGVKKALSFLGSDPFFVANCDSFFRPKDPNPFTVLGQKWAQQSAKAMLLVEDRSSAVGYDGAGDFFMADDGALTRRGSRPEAPYVFTGLQILDPGLFEDIDDEVFSLNRIYDKALQEKVLAGVCYPRPWYHIGTPETVREVSDLE